MWQVRLQQKLAAVSVATVLESGVLEDVLLLASGATLENSEKSMAVVLLIALHPFGAHLVLLPKCTKKLKTCDDLEKIKNYKNE